MQTTATFPTRFSHIPQALETVAVRCTTQLLAISADPVNTDPDLFGKLQRNLNGILRSLALVEKRQPQPPAKPSQPPVMDIVDAANNPKPQPPSQPGKTTPQNPICVSVTKPEPETPPNPSPQTPPAKRLSKRDRRLMKRFRRKERKKELKRNGKKSKLVQTSEQKPLLTNTVEAIPAFTPG